MIAISSPLLWYTSRASGIVSMLLLTAAMVLGIMTATRVGGGTVPRFAVAEIHRRISLLTMAFLAIHVGTTAIDTFVSVHLISAFVPFTSSYKPAYVSLGAVAFDLLIAVSITSLLKDRMSHAAWRTVHWISYLAFPTAILHNLLIGTDQRFIWMLLLTASCVGVVSMALAWRIWAHPRPKGALTAVPSRTAPSKRSKAIVTRAGETSNANRRASSSKRRPRP
jgi:DMSO/TMAO reductase YedYZ heme-binding membrane subunit